MRKYAISRTVHVTVIISVFVFAAMVTSCNQETARTSDQLLSSCSVFADRDFSPWATHQEFEASYADYAHLLRGTLGEDDILRHCRQRLESLEQLREHYCETVARDLPALVRDAFTADWNAWTEWQVFSEKYGPDDELWYFACPVSQEGKHATRRGYVILRDGELAAMLLNRTVVFHARYADYETLLNRVATQEQIVDWRRQRFDSLEELHQHYGSRFQEGSSHILLEDHCDIGATGTPTKWDHWQVFGRSYEAGDELWYFESPAETWKGPAGRCGYLVLRDGQLHAILVVAIS